MAIIYGEGVRPSLCVMGTGIDEGYGPYKSAHVVSFVWACFSFSAVKFVIDVDGLINVVRSTEDSVVMFDRTRTMIDMLVVD